VVLAAVAALTFTASAALAKVAFPGHSKRPIRALTPPARFLETVRRDELQSGVLAPAQADPATATAQT